jgi:DNA mismatch endonuclease, patch repair protein
MILSLQTMSSDNPRRSAARTSARMSKVKQKDTGPEMVCRRLVHGLGYRYRLYEKALPGKPDLVFTGRRKVIFVHGCFWHGHNCRAGRNQPTSNRRYWGPKLRRNQERDARNQERLLESGWSVLIVWECETADLNSLKIRICDFLEG